MNLSHLKGDARQIIREPILIIFMLIPFLMFVLAKLLLVYGVPLIFNFININLLNYLSYIFAIVMVTVPSLLGSAVGFLMIDERDNKIYQLMSILPIGYKGYIRHRLILIMGLTVVYTFLGNWILQIQNLSIIKVSTLAIFTSIQGCINALVLFHFAQDKVKGLTLAKGMTLINIFIFVDMMNVPILHWIAWAIPQYWVIRILQYPGQIRFILTGCLVHFVWLSILFYKRQKNC